jgi:DNA-binding MarR family transcriptional regulator
VGGDDGEGLSEAQYRTLAEFRRALRSFAHFSEAAARGAGLTPQHHQAILAIKGHAGAQGCTVSDLAAALRLRHHSAAELAGRLEDADLIARTPAEDDRRKVVLTLTPKAEDALRALSRQHLEELRQIGPALIELLQRVREG